MKRIILVRHAESQANVDSSHYETIPDHAFTITEKGEAQALEAGKTIKNIIGDDELVAYVSPYRRTQMTFAGICQSIDDNIVKAYEDPRIREQDLGLFQTKAELIHAYRQSVKYGRFYYRFDNGESVADVYTRANSFIETLYRDAQKADFPDTVLVVTHGIAMRVLAMILQCETEAYFHTLQNPQNGEVVVFEAHKDVFGGNVFVPTEPMTTRDEPLTDF